MRIGMTADKPTEKIGMLARIEAYGRRVMFCGNAMAVAVPLVVLPRPLCDLKGWAFFWLLKPVFIIENLVARYDVDAK